MQKLFLDEKTGFKTSQHFEIYDVNGKLFYSSEFTTHILNGEVLKFNLPVGEYLFNGQLTKLPNPVSFKKIALPKPERIIENGDYQIVYGENPNKCTIFYDEKLIVFDDSFKDAPLYVIFGIYYHEMGHHFYETEEYADKYMINKMLEEGFNPSQIGYLPLMALNRTNPDSFSRIKKIVNQAVSVRN